MTGELRGMNERTYINRRSYRAQKSIRLTLDTQCPRCDAEPGVMCVDPITREPVENTCHERRLESEFGTITPARQVTYALAIWPLDVVSRATLRALLPKGTTRPVGLRQQAKSSLKGEGWRTENHVSRKFQSRLWRLEQAGHISRGTQFVRILNRRALLDWALADIAADDNVQHDKFLLLEQAAQTVADQLKHERDKRIKELRTKELAIIRQLMQPHTMNGRDSRRRLVRHESGQITIPLGDTTGQRDRPDPTPVFPVITKQLPDTEPAYDIYGDYEDWE